MYATTTKPRIYTVPEVADYLGVSRTLIYALINRGDLRSIKVGRMRRVPERALIAFIDVQLDARDATSDAVPGREDERLRREHADRTTAYKQPTGNRVR